MSHLIDSGTETPESGVTALGGNRLLHESLTPESRNASARSGVGVDVIPGPAADSDPGPTRSLDRVARRAIKPWNPWAGSPATVS
ncbi:MAG: hypothetical protein OXD36_06240 [Rhodobacter sp.]|nr:hypothetical protein [Rhodobacter sp.]MCY4241324.1 hypothetical protein [Rhodobacter sp.]